MKQQKSNTTTARDVLWIIRLYYLFSYSAMGSIEPYLTLHYHSTLNLNGPMIGILDSVFSITTFVATPLWGLLLTTRRPKNSHKSNPPYFGIMYVNSIISRLAFRYLQQYQTERNTTTSLILCICLLAMALAPMKPLMDSVVVTHAACSSSFGRLRLFGTIGYGLGTSLVGLLRRSNSVGETRIVAEEEEEHIIRAISTRFVAFVSNAIDDHHLPFMVHFALSIPAFFSILAFHRMHVQNHNHVVQEEAEENSKSLSSSPSKANTTSTTLPQVLIRNWTFFVLTFQLGASNGVTEAFCSLGMTQAGISTKAIGLFRLLSIAASIPMYWCAGSIHQRLRGGESMFVLILVVMAIRLIAYGLVEQHAWWWSVVAEGLRGIVAGLYQSTNTVHTHRMAPPELCASVSLLTGAVYQGLGRSMGSLVGGYLQNTMGTSQTFLWLGSFDMVFAMVFLMATMMKANTTIKKKQH